MADVTQFPLEKVYPNSVKGKEIWAQKEPPSEMVWAVCPWMRQHNDDSRCRRCPRFEEDPDYGQMQRGCYGMAAEVCRVVFAMQNRAPQPPAAGQG